MYSTQFYTKNSLYVSRFGWIYIIRWNQINQFLANVPIWYPLKHQEIFNCDKGCDFCRLGGVIILFFLNKNETSVHEFHAFIIIIKQSQLSEPFVISSPTSSLKISCCTNSFLTTFRKFSIVFDEAIFNNFMDWSLSYPLKTLENLWFSNVSKGHSKTSVRWNGLRITLR